MLPAGPDEEVDAFWVEEDEVWTGELDVEPTALEDVDGFWLEEEPVEEAFTDELDVLPAGPDEEVDAF